MSTRIEAANRDRTPVRHRWRRSPREAILLLVLVPILGGFVLPGAGAAGSAEGRVPSATDGSPPIGKRIVSLATLLAQRPAARTVRDSPFYIYEDASSPRNRFQPTGYMGDVGDIRIDQAFTTKPHSGSESIQIIYTAKGGAPHDCPYKGPCRWAGVYWQEPPNNWGKEAALKGRGFDLSGYDRLVFWARADKPARIEFKVGGIDGRYGDSLRYARSTVARLTENWQPFEIDLAGADLRHIVGGFCWVTNWDINPQGVTFYLDDIRFETR